MPAPIELAHRLVKRQAQVRKAGKLKWLRPDAKSQVTLRYEDDRPVGIEAVVLSTQHGPDISHQALREAVMEEIIKPALPKKWIDKRTKYHINPTGRFVVGGPVGRLRPHGAQDHRRHLRRLCPPRRRRLLRQGPLQGGPLGRLCGALRRQEHRRRGARRALRGAGLLRHRRGRADLDHGRDLRHQLSVRRAARRAGAPAFRSHPLWPARDARPGAADLPQDRRLRPFRPQRAGIHLGAHGSRGELAARSGR